MTEEVYLNLSKENFKFSSAHFLIFDDKNAEMLHGHNYQVQVSLFPKPNLNFTDLGYIIDFSDIKKIVKNLCDVWDEHILLPERHKDIKYKISNDTKNYEIHFRDRYYSFPIVETIFLPIANTSVEQLSKLFAESLLNKMDVNIISKIKVTIEETNGQSASTILTR